MADAADTLSIKVLLLGSERVGKSSLVDRFAREEVRAEYVKTIGLEFAIKTIDIADGRRVQIRLWDTSGDERMREIVAASVRGSQGVLLVYDVTNERSFLDVRDRLRDVPPNYCHTILVGNKVDVDTNHREVSTQQGQALADELGISFYETSAKDDYNVHEAFKAMAIAVQQQYDRVACPPRTWQYACCSTM